MNMSTDTALINQIKKLKDIEGKFLKLEYEHRRPVTEKEVEAYLVELLKIATTAFEIRNQIKLALSNHSTLTIDSSEVRSTLSKVRKNEKFSSIFFYEKMMGIINESTKDSLKKYPESIDDLVTGEWLGDIIDDFHSWFDLARYYKSKIRIGAIVSSSNIPKNVEVYFNEIKEAYAYGLYISSVALCRTLVEFSLYDVLAVFGIVDNRPKVADIKSQREDLLFKMIETARQYNIIDDKVKSLLHDIRMNANKILHRRDNQPTGITDQIALQIITKTIRCVECLFFKK